MDEVFENMGAARAGVDATVAVRVAALAPVP